MITDSTLTPIIPSVNVDTSHRGEARMSCWPQSVHDTIMVAWNTTNAAAAMAIVKGCQKGSFGVRVSV